MTVGGVEGVLFSKRGRENRVSGQIEMKINSGRRMCVTREKEWSTKQSLCEEKKAEEHDHEASFKWESAGAVRIAQPEMGGPFVSSGRELLKIAEHMT
jgi:hypothetical protein